MITFGMTNLKFEIFTSFLLKIISHLNTFGKHKQVPYKFGLAQNERKIMLLWEFVMWSKHWNMTLLAYLKSCKCYFYCFLSQNTLYWWTCGYEYSNFLYLLIDDNRTAIQNIIHTLVLLKMLKNTTDWEVCQY